MTPSKPRCCITSVLWATKLELSQPEILCNVKVKLAERVSGPIGRGVKFSCIWGDGLDEFHREMPRAKIINLETAITRSETYWETKDIHYRMSPENIGCLTAAGINCCVLANNHTRDWGVTGLLDTLHAFDQAGIKHAGAGRLFIMRGRQRSWTSERA
jgi:poly-gamma-glutamate capsule biosynthesis protein CapA/YwtB (metallophosphatase superfamily)